ncbi:MAG: restriction endonuclease subunit S [Gemmatimonadota bacterium]|nr:restriction endonuclease subunit S [Gemmatimonadota bacterium]
MTRITHRIGDICTLVKGTYPTMKTEPGPYPLVVTAAERRSASSFSLEGPAVCIPLISSTGHGHAAIHRLHYQEGKFALANLLVALLPKDGAVYNPRYLYHLLSTKKDELLVPLMQGTANVALKEKDIAGVEISLPPVEEQRRIVARIEELVAKVEEARGLRRSIAAEQETLLRSAFAKISRGAPRRPMKEVAPLVRRPVRITASESYHELGIRSFGRGTFHKPAVSGASLGTKKLFEIWAGDLLFNIVFAWEGAVAVARPEDEGRVGSHRFLTCVPRQGAITAPFLKFYFLTEEGLAQLGEASPGGAGRNRTLGLKALEQIEVPVPPFAEQSWFDRLQSLAGWAIELQFESATELDTLVRSILDKAFRGEL